MADSERPRRTHPSVGNVIYANFGNTTKVSTPKPAVQKETRTSLASMLLIDAATTATDSERVKRGRAYARNGNVVNLEFTNGRIIAAVAGSQNQPFNVDVVLPPRNADQLNTVTQLLLEPGSLAEAKEGKA